MWGNKLDPFTKLHLPTTKLIFWVILHIFLSFKFGLDLSIYCLENIIGVKLSDIIKVADKFKDETKLHMGLQAQQGGNP